MLAADPPPLPHRSTAEGRPLRVECRGAASAPRRLLVVAAIHGDEPQTKGVTHALAQRRAPDGMRVCVVHRLNPDGLARGRRTNARAVDLNRNFPHRWRPGPFGRFNPGPAAGSERETRYAMALSDALRPTLTIWVHQPYGFVVDGRGVPRATLRAYARRTRMPVRRLPAYRGTAAGWQASRGLRAFTVELPAGRVAPATARRHADAALRAVAELSSAS